MKRLVCTVCSVLLCAGLLSGCGTSLEGEESVVYVGKKGAIASLDVETLDQSYYDETELKSYVDAEVEDYTAEHGKNAVKVESLKVEDGVAKLKMKYKTPEDYTAFNGIELYQGKVVASLAAGYVYDGEFARVEEGKVVGAATKQDIYSEDDLKVAIIRANTDVKVDGEICYVSCQNVKLTGKDSVSIRDGYYLETGSVTASVDVTGQESVGTEQLSGTEQMEMTGEPVNADDTEQTETAAGDGSFETDVYTFIVYK